MKKTLGYVACALLVLAIGCGDDSGGTTKEDAGPSGTGGKTSGTGGKSSGTGGKGSGTGGKGSGGAGGSGALTTDSCITMTTALMVPSACAKCVCEKDLTNSGKCLKDAMCWPLLDCLGKNCPNDPMAGCYMTSCKDSAAGITTVASIGPTITMMCKDECVPKAPATDGGTDAGN